MKQNIYKSIQETNIKSTKEKIIKSISFEVDRIIGQVLSSKSKFTLFMISFTFHFKKYFLINLFIWILSFPFGFIFLWFGTKEAKEILNNVDADHVYKKAFEQIEEIELKKIIPLPSKKSKTKKAVSPLFVNRIYGIPSDARIHKESSYFYLKANEKYSMQAQAGALLWTRSNGNGGQRVMIENTGYVMMPINFLKGLNFSISTKKSFFKKKNINSVSLNFDKTFTIETNDELKVRKWLTLHMMEYYLDFREATKKVFKKWTLEKIDDNFILRFRPPTRVMLQFALDKRTKNRTIANMFKEDIANDVVNFLLISTIIIESRKMRN